MTMITDGQVREWTKQAGLHIATSFDLQMFRRFAEVVLKSVEPEVVAKPTQKKKSVEVE